MLTARPECLPEKMCPLGPCSAGQTDYRKTFSVKIISIKLQRVDEGHKSGWADAARPGMPAYAHRTAQPQFTVGMAR